MINSFLNLYSLLFSRVAFEKLNKLLFMMGCRGLGLLNYKTAYASGEEPFLQRFLEKFDHNEAIVVDVGANSGQFASWVIRNTCSLSVVSFEPHPISIKKFQNSKVASSGRVSLIQKGLSDEVGSSVIFDYSDADRQGSQHASMYKGVIADLHKSANPSSLKIDLTTLDREFKDNKEKICLLKIDVEGHELSVLRGGTKLINEAIPPAILIEFNEMNAVSGAHYNDFVGVLGDLYIPFRLLPGGKLLSLEGQSPLFTELYAYQNIVFLKKPGI